MGGVTSSTGLVSGIDYQSLINQLLALEAQPKALAQQRIVSLQGDQAAFLDLKGRLNSLKTAAAAFRANNIFASSAVSSSDESVLTASASTGAPVGGFSFLVDRVVGTQQVLSRGFADRNGSSIGATSLTVESSRARLDSDTALSALNGGSGAQRGKIVVTDHSGARGTIDLSRVATVGELVDAINSADSVRVRARVDGDKLVIEDETGVGGTLTIANADGYNTATSLGIEGSAANSPLTGQRIYYIGDATNIQSFNDGNGIRVNTAAGAGVTADFTIKTRDGAAYSIDIGEMYDMVDGKLTKTKAAVADVAGLRARIEEQTDGYVTLATTADGRGLRLVDSTVGTDPTQVVDIKGAAADLGLVGSSTNGTLDGSAVIAGLNSTLVSNLSGGSGLADGTFSITTRDGAVHNFSVATGGSLSDILSQIESGTGGAVTARVSDDGVGLTLTDNTAGSGNLIVGGAGATALGVATAPGGVAAATVAGSRLQHRYISGSTSLLSFNNGAGVGSGVIEIRGPRGTTTRVDIGTDARNIADVIAEINSRGIGVTARINDHGDGIIIEKSAGETGLNKIKVSDVTGTVGKSLGIIGEAANTTDQNFVDGSFEKTVQLTAADTLDSVVTKINNSQASVSASVIRDSAGSSQYRLKLTAKQTGVAGAFTITSTGADLGLTTISKARNARVFFGSDDPATAVLIESTSNTIDGVVEGLTLNAKAASNTPVTVTVSRDTGAIKDAVRSFIDAFNDVAGRVDQLTAYDQETDRKGPLLGDSTANELRAALYNQLLRPATGLSGSYKYLNQVGVKVGQGGALELDEAKLDAALAADPQGVADLFAARTQNTRDTQTTVRPGITVNNTDPDTFSALGVAEQFANFVDRYVNGVDGVLTRRSNSLDSEIANQNDRIATLDAKLARRRDYLTQQFATLETTLAGLQRQQAALSQIPAR